MTDVLPQGSHVVRLDAGEFVLQPLDPARHLGLLHGWMHDPEVERYWEMAWPQRRLADYLAAQLAGRHSRPYLGVLDGEPMSYWELYRVDRDRIAPLFDSLPGDAGLHLLFGSVAHRGRGLAAPLLAAVSSWQLCCGAGRVVAEPDVGNTRSLRAFQRAGFRRTGAIDLPEKRAALLMRHP